MKRVEIDWDDVKKLAHIQCTIAEIAAFLDVSVETMHRRAKQEYDTTIGSLIQKWGESGRCSLRRKQWHLAEKSATMAIFLGKNMLGQADKVDLNDDTKKLIRDYMMNEASEYKRQIQNDDTV